MMSSKPPSSPRQPEIVHANPYFDVVRSRFAVQGGSTIDYWSIRKPDFSLMLAENDGQFATLRVYRPLIGKDVLEFPQGASEAGEPAEDTARRELAEEAGLRVGDLRHVASLYESYGMSGCCCHIFRGEISGDADAPSDPAEDVRAVEFLTIGQLRSAVRTGMVLDAVSVAALALITGEDQ
jgi:8-oxo-dGTP pyrophosphatase MutT (NUDIX family)